MKNFIESEPFKTITFVVALISGVIWMIWPQAGWWSILIALLPWLARLIFGITSFPRTPLDLILGLFIISAFIGYRVSYDTQSAAIKFGAIIASILIFYGLVIQSRKIFIWVSLFLYAFGVLISGYFFLTHDFIANPRRISFINKAGIWFMGLRPKLELPAVHPNYIAGLAVITSLFGLYLVWRVLQSDRPWIGLSVLMTGYGMVFLALIASTSRGIWMAVVSVLGVILIWFAFDKLFSISSSKKRQLFPIVVVVYLVILFPLVYLIPAKIGYDPGTQLTYGSGSRAELFNRSLSILADFPITGGGLSAFPGLYSHYILSIPYFYVANSHNLFLDVAIEQGLISGIAFLSLYLGSVWYVSRSLVKEMSIESKIVNWLTLFSLIIAIVHGMVDNYLFNGKWAVFSLFLISISMWVVLTYGNQRNNSLRSRTKRKSIRVNPIYPVELIFYSLILIISVVSMFRLDNIRAIWYANLGAIKMAKYDLRNFPNRGWDSGSNINDLAAAQQNFEQAIQSDAYNLTANYRLGLIFLLKKDFQSALGNLEIAHKIDSDHRGITKNLGYCNLWLNNKITAKELLTKIPEANAELDAYVSWWYNHNEPELSEYALDMSTALSQR